MSRQDVVAVLVAVLVPIVTALAGTVALLLQDWQVRRSRAGRRRLAFEDAGRQVAFTAEWWQAQQLLPTDPRALQDAAVKAQGWLDQASALAAAAGRSRIDVDPPVTPSRLLLLYGFNSRSAKVIRLGFHASLAVMAFGSLSAVGNGVSGATGGVAWVVVWSVLFGVLALFLRFWAVSVDTSGQQPSPPP